MEAHVGSPLSCLEQKHPEGVFRKLGATPVSSLKRCLRDIYPDVHLSVGAAQSLQRSPRPCRLQDHRPPCRCTHPVPSPPTQRGFRGHGGSTPPCRSACLHLAAPWPFAASPAHPSWARLPNGSRTQQMLRLGVSETPWRPKWPPRRSHRHSRRAARWLCWLEHRPQVPRLWVRFPGRDSCKNQARIHQHIEQQMDVSPLSLCPYPFSLKIKNKNEKTKETATEGPLPPGTFHRTLVRNRKHRQR